MMQQRSNNTMPDALPRGDVRPFEVMEAFREAAALEAQGRDIVHLSLGQPGRAAPQPVLEYMAKLLPDGVPGYTDARGMPELRERIARHYGESYDLEINPARVFVTVGSSSAFSLALLALFEAGDRIGIARPCYPAYPNMMQACNVQPVFIETGEDSRFQPTPKHMKQVGELDGLITASPSNPTGTMLRRDELIALSDVCKERGIRMICDEIYHHVTYKEKADTILRHNPDALVVNSFSKYYLLPGWRLGWAVVPESHIRRYESLLQSFYVSPPSISQIAALKVFDCKQELGDAVAEYTQNRMILRDGLRKLGFQGRMDAEGAFYIYTDISPFSSDSKQFCRDMLHEAGVAAVPGIDFDPDVGKHYVRFSFAGTPQNMHEAISRLENWLKGYV